MTNIQVDSSAPCNYVEMSDIDNKKGDASEDTIKVLKTVKSPKTQYTNLT